MAKTNVPKTAEISKPKTFVIDEKDVPNFKKILGIASAGFPDSSIKSLIDVINKQL